MLAIIKTGGKQYIVSPGQKIKIDPPAALRAAMRAGKIEGQEIIFDQVLLLEKDGELKIGTPFVEGVKVAGKVLKQGKAKKVIVFKIRPKKRYKVKKGHRQPFTEVEITKISN
ncbi:50S ribosomal protein L21 [Patescibacteria group bacterium]|nr:50S ribosomal protein L21 [Patescibacteria group bacterium]MBU4481242.1 50S ribosomal protein L21 [Patescibacteria group bacterium]